MSGWSERAASDAIERVLERSPNSEVNDSGDAAESHERV